MNNIFHCIDLQEESLEALVAHQIPHWVAAPKLTRLVTLNGELFTQARRKPSTLRLIRNTPCIADGVGVLALFRLAKGRRLPRIPGISLIEALFRVNRYRFFLLGGREGTLAKASTRLSARYPGSIVGSHHGYFSAQDWPKIQSEIQAAKPDIILVGMGFPRQEVVLKTLEAAGVCGLGIGVGGAFEVWAQTKKRAPDAFQSLGLEWLWRLLLSPRRITRFSFVVPYLRLVRKARERL